MIEIQELFTARQGGFWIYRIPGIQVTPRGVALVTCEARRGSGGDWDASDILMRRSLDGGRSWQEPVCLFSSAEFGPGPMNNIVLASSAQTGYIHALFCHDYCRVYHSRSSDDGLTFSSPVEITSVLEGFLAEYPWKVVALGPGHATTLRSGRIVAPVWLSDGSGTEFGPGLRGHRPSCAAVIYSDDGGESWARGEIVIPVDGFVDPSEAVCVELEDGRVHLNVRSESPRNRRLVSISPDGARGWSKPEYHPDLLEPVCMAGLIRHSFRQGDTPGRILFSNPDNLEHEFANWGGAVCDRKRLTVKMSRDDGATWPVARVVEAGPAGYSDLAVLPGGEILLFYESGMLEDMGDTRALALARFDLNWLEGKDAT